MASLSEVQSRIKHAVSKLSSAERAALKEAVRATRRVLASSDPKDLKSVVRRLEAIARRPTVKRALQKLATESGADTRTLVRVLKRAAHKHRS